MYPLPFFAFFIVPFALAPVGPSRSSILLALLMLVPGRLGGPVTPAVRLVLLWLLLIAGGAAGRNVPSAAAGAGPSD